MRLSGERPTAPRGELPSAALPRIMIVDDREEDLDLAWADIENGGYEIARISDPLTALDRAKSWTPTVAVLDYKMYPLNGVELAEKLKARYPDILIIFVTSDETDEIRQACLRAGNDFIQKPIKKEDLLLRIEEKLRIYERYIRRGRSAERSAAEPPFPDLRPQERRLFDMLLVGAGEVIERDELKEALWGDDALDGEDMLNTTVSRLRAAIEREPDYPPIIITRRRRGYLLDLSALRLAYGDQF